MRHNPNVVVSCVEISRDVVEASKLFGVDYHEVTDKSSSARLDKQRLNVYVDDIFNFASETQHSYDFIIMDVFTNNTFPESLLTVDFYKSLARLSPQIAINAGNGSSVDQNLAIMSQILPVVQYHDFDNNENIVLGSNKITENDWAEMANQMLQLCAPNIPFKPKKMRVIDNVVAIKFDLNEEQTSQTKKESDQNRSAENPVLTSLHVGDSELEEKAVAHTIEQPAFQIEIDSSQSAKEEWKLFD
jgi:hypothetical protein